MQDALQALLRHHNDRLQPLHAEYNDRFWKMSLTGTSESLDALVAAKSRYLDVYRDPIVFQRLRSMRASPEEGLEPLVARELHCVYLDFLPYQMEGHILEAIIRHEARVENVFNTFRADLDGRKVSDNEIRELMGALGGFSGRQRVWEASKQVGGAVASDVVELVELRNLAARRLGFADYYLLALETQELDEQWLSSLLDDLEEASEPAFLSAKRELDDELRYRFGVSGFESYPWLYSDPFFQELPAREVTRKLDSIFGELSIESLTRKHFESLGLKIGDLLERADLYEREGKSQHAFCLDVDRAGDVRVLCNLRPNEWWMGVMLHEFGHAVYDKYNDANLPFTLRKPAHILTTEAVAMLNGRMTKNPSWLVRFAGVSRETAAALRGEMFRASRASMLVFLRWTLTLVRFERELYRDPKQDLCQLWWHFVERIQKVTPPAGRDQPDWASKIHLATAPVYYHNYLLGELMASQVLEYVERELVGGADMFTPEVGSYMVERLFKQGARWSWNALLERATGERLTTRHFLRQFEIA